MELLRSNGTCADATTNFKNVADGGVAGTCQRGRWTSCVQHGGGSEGCSCGGQPFSDSVASSAPLLKHNIDTALISARRASDEWAQPVKKREEGAEGREKVRLMPTSQQSRKPRRSQKKRK